MYTLFINEFPVKKKVNICLFYLFFLVLVLFLVPVPVPLPEYKPDTLSEPKKHLQKKIK